MLIKERTVQDVQGFVRSLRGRAPWDDIEEESIEVVDEDLTMEFASSGATSRIDRNAGVVRNVKILGKLSKNKGGVYPVEVMRAAVGLYENAKVNIDHTREGEANPSVLKRFGMIRNARLVGEEIRGDLHFNPKHPSAEQFIWAVEHQPESIGFSHIAMVEWRPTKGGRIAQRIKSVKSVDIVSEPATTSGVFEDTYDGPDTQYDCESSAEWVARLRGKSPPASIGHQEAHEQRGQPKRSQGGYHYASSAEFVAAFRRR